jgi:uncharacterized Fe-S radical SAM superfamily protein PflX
MSDFLDLEVWDDRALRLRLAWYRKVASGAMPAKALIASRVPAEVDLGAQEPALWLELERRSAEFLDLWRAVREGRSRLERLPCARPSLVELTSELARRMLRHCNFCRWDCGVDRGAGTKPGTCQLAETSRVSSYFHHRGEERVYQGHGGSGTIFFTSCNLRCSFCVHPDTYVLTATGPVRICDLYSRSEGETIHNGGSSRIPEALQVFTREGRSAKAIRVFKHEYSGELVVIEPFHGPGILVTPEHRIPACKHREAEPILTRAAELESGHWLAIPRPAFLETEEQGLDVAGMLAPLAEGSSYITRARFRMPVIQQAHALARAGANSTEIACRLGYHPTYVRALLSRIRRSGLPGTSCQNGLVIEDGTVRLKTEKRPGIPSRLEIGEGLAEFLGYYCAEGHVQKVSKRPSSHVVVLSFGPHEKNLVRRASELFRGLFGIRPRIVRRRTTLTVECGKVSLALLLKTLCGSGAATKRVPEFLFQAPPRVVEAYLNAFAAGDGCTTGGYVSLNTISESLAMGLYGLYLKLGHLPSFNVYEPPPEKLIEGRRVNQSTLYYVKVNAARMLDRSWDRARHVKYCFGDDSIRVPIHRISRIPYSGPVYNLEVDNKDHTYAANFIAVGNCQNGDISTDKDNGVAVTSRQLAAMAWQLRLEGCHNINWVGGDPTIHLHTILEAIALCSEEGFRPTDAELLHASGAKSDGFVRFRPRPEEAFFGGQLNAPMLWNSNFFMSAPTMKLLRVLMDVWLPDLKFGPGPCAVKLSRTPWYWETVTGNLLQLHGWGEDFTIRHLIMPAHVECCTVPVLDWIAQHMPHVPVNIMDQYHPDNFCDPRSSKYSAKYAELSRRPSADELRSAYRHAKELGLEFEALSYE